MDSRLVSTMIVEPVPSMAKNTNPIRTALFNPDGSPFTGGGEPPTWDSIADKPNVVAEGDTPQEALASIGGVDTEGVQAVAASYLASNSAIVDAAAAAAGPAVSAAGERTFFLVSGATDALKYPRFEIAPGDSATVVSGNWYNVVNPARTWLSIPDTPFGVGNVVRFTETDTYIRQRRSGWATAGLVGKTLTIAITARAIAAGGSTTASVRALISRVTAPAATLIDARVGTVGTSWSTIELTFVIPSDIADGTIQFNFAVHGSAPVGSGQLEIASIRSYVASEDLPSVVNAVAKETATKGAGGSWSPLTTYSVGATVVSALGHRLRCVSAHTSATRFTDDLPKWLPVDEPPRERRLLAQSALGHGQVIGVGNRSVIALRFDDWHIAFRDNVLPLLVERGFPAGLASISNLSEQPWASGITPSDIRSWNRQGIEIQSHGVDHKDPSPQDLTGSGGLADQIINSKITIESWGVSCRGWMQPGASPLISGVVPYGTDFTNWDSLDGYAAWLIRDTYPVSESYVWGSISRPLPHRQFHGADHLTISDGMLYADVMNTLNQRIQRNENIELMIHAGNIGASGNITLVEFTNILDWIASQRDAGKAEVLTPSGLFFADRTSIRTQALRYGSFEEGTLGWTNFGGNRSLQTSGGRTGPNFARFGSSETGLITQAILTLKARGWQGQTFQFEGYARAVSGTTTSRVTLAGSDLNADLTRANIGTEWTPVRHAFTIPPDAATVTLGFGRGGGSGIDWDDLSIHPV